MPKCGGTSFMEILKRCFKWRFAKDNDFPVHKTKLQQHKQAERARKRMRLRQKYLLSHPFKQCIHGHFLPYKYKDFSHKNGTIFVT
jgi:hypothetical protein